MGFAPLYILLNLKNYKQKPFLEYFHDIQGVYPDEEQDKSCMNQT